MYKKLSETEITKINKTQEDLLKKVLTKLKRIIDNTPRDDAAKIEEKGQGLVERILEFTNKIQSGQRLKILRPSQMLIRLPITSAQSKAGNNSEKLKNEIRQLLYSLCRSKKLTKTICNILIKTT